MQLKWIVIALAVGLSEGVRAIPVAAQVAATGVDCTVVEQPREMKTPGEYIQGGDARVCQEDWEGAIAAYREAIALAQSNPAQWEGEQAMALLRLAPALMIGDPVDLEGVIETYRQAIALDPLYGYTLSDRDNSPLGEPVTDFGLRGDATPAPRQAEESIEASAYFETGWALTKQENWLKAIAMYQKAIELSPTFAHAYNELGYALFRMERYDEAQAALERALAINPDLVWAHYHLAYLLTWRHQPEKGFQHFRQVINFHTGLDTLGEEVKDAMTYSFIGDVFMTQANPPSAVEAYQKAIALFPQDSRVYLRLGVAFLEWGNNEQAGIAFREALRLLPNAEVPRSEEMALDLAQAYIFEQQWEKAAVVLQDLMARSPQSFRAQTMWEYVQTHLSPPSL